MAYSREGSFLQPFLEGQRIYNERLQMANETDRQNQAAQLNQARIQLMKAQIARIQAMTQGLLQNGGISPTVSLGQQELAERKREFDIRQQNLQNGTGAGMAGGSRSAMLNAMQQAQDILQKNNAIRSDGTIDTSKLPPNDLANYNILSMYVQKLGTHAQAENRFAQFNNAATTLSKIDPTVLEHYAGPKGHAKLLKDMALSAKGKAPDIFNQYQAIVNSLIPMAADQMGQAFGASIQPSAAALRDKAIHPDQWFQNPESVLAGFNAINDLVQTEQGIAQARLTNPNYIYTGQSAAVTSPYTGQTNSFGTQSAPAPKSSAATSVQSDGVIGKSGRFYSGDDIQNAASRAGKTVDEIKKILQERG